jgi:hypothetical protein
VLAFRLIRRSLRFIYGLLPAFTHLLLDRLFPLSFTLASLPFVCEGGRGLPIAAMSTGRAGVFLVLPPFGLGTAFVGLAPSPKLVGS